MLSFAANLVQSHYNYSNMELYNDIIMKLDILVIYLQVSIAAIVAARCRMLHWVPEQFCIIFIAVNYP